MSQVMLHVDQLEHQCALDTQGNLPRDYNLCIASQANADWEKQLSNAKISWAKLTEQELIKSEGSAKKLAGLVQQRYALSHIDAEKQVNAFLKKNNTSINTSMENHYE